MDEYSIKHSSSLASGGEKHILVLGGTGFVGSAVVRTLLTGGSGIRVTMLVHRSLAETEDPSVQFLHGSLGQIDLGQVMQDPPTHVVHLARFPGSSPWRRTFAGLRGACANVRLLRGLCRLPYPPRILYVSGSLMYGSRGESWVDEDTPLQPTSFGRAYIIGERPLLRYQASGKLPVMMVRPPWILGVGSWFQTYYATPMMRQGCVPCYGEGNNWMSLLHLEDCARLIQHALLHGMPGETYNLALPPVRQIDFCAYLSERSGLPLKVIPRGTLARRRDRSLMEAFGSSIRLRSRHADFLVRCPLRFGSVRAAIDDILARFEHV